MPKHLALFDFDGTLTHRDSLADFIQYSCGLPKTIVGSIVLSPVLISQKLGLYSNTKAKQRVIAHFFKGFDQIHFTHLGDDYATARLPKILRETALKKLNWHKEMKHEVVIVTASIEEWIKPWARKVGVYLIATRLERKNGYLTGRFETPNCQGEEKVRRIQQVLNLNTFDFIYAYGDTNGDKQMLELADEAHYKAFK